MSQLTDFAKSAFSASKSIIGGESLTISNGPSISCVMNEVVTNRDYDSGGYDAETTFSAVTSIYEFESSYSDPTSNYQGKIANARGEQFRIETIEKGQSFVTIRMISIERGS